MTCVDWSKSDFNTIVSGDVNGHIVIWNLSSNKCNIYMTESNSVTAIECSPHSPSLAAIGYSITRVLFYYVILRKVNKTLIVDTKAAYCFCLILATGQSFKDCEATTKRFKHSVGVI